MQRRAFGSTIPAGWLTRFPLRPPAGRQLPPELEPGAAYREAAALPRGVRDPAFAGFLARIDASYFHTSLNVECQHDGRAAFAEAEEAMRGARREILVESYILRDDATGHRLLEILGDAAARGVTVRVLADAVGSWRTGAAYWREMSDRGIAYRRFQGWWRRPFQLVYRDHRKLLVVDREVAFTGGLNVADEYGGRDDRPIWRDSQVRVEGTAALELAAVFREGWMRAGGRAFNVRVPRAVDTAGAKVMVLDARPGRGHAESASVLAAIAGGARQRLWITNAYFAPARIAIDILADTVQRGVDVRLLLPGRTDVAVVRHAGHGFFPALLERGIQIYEFQPTVLHAKTLVADDFVSVVGSTNLDFRSFRFNAECNLIVLDEPTAGDLARAFERDVSVSLPITASTWQRTWWHRVGDTLARRLAPLL